MRFSCDSTECGNERGGYTCRLCHKKRQWRGDILQLRLKLPVMRCNYLEGKLTWADGDAFFFNKRQGPFGPFGPFRPFQLSRNQKKK